MYPVVTKGGVYDMCKILNAFIIVLWFAGSAFGQGGLGSISGTVVDPSGAVIPSASVVLLEIQTQTTRSITTNEVGLFVLPSDVPGRYTVTVSAPGF